MKKTILELYALAVCFVTVVCGVVALGIGAYSVLAIGKPDFTIDTWSYSQHQTNDAYWNACSGGCAGAYRVPPATGKERPTDAELTKLRETSYAAILSNEQRNAAQTLTKTLIVLLIDSVAFVFHWQVAKRARANAA